MELCVCVCVLFLHFGIRAGWLMVEVHSPWRHWSHQPPSSHSHADCSSDQKLQHIPTTGAQECGCYVRLMALSHCSCPDCSDTSRCACRKKKKKACACMQLYKVANLYRSCVRCVSCARRAYLRVWHVLAQVGQNYTLFPRRPLKDAPSWAQSFKSQFLETKARARRS